MEVKKELNSLRSWKLNAPHRTIVYELKIVMSTNVVS